jgi:hypothetical protein
VRVAEECEWSLHTAPDDRDRAALRSEQVTSDQEKGRQNRLTNYAGFSEGDQVWLYRPTRNRGKSPKYHLDQQHGLQGPVTSQREDDTGSCRQVNAVPGGYYGLAELRN